MIRRTSFSMVLALILAACGQTDNAAPYENAVENKPAETSVEPAKTPAPEAVETTTSEPGITAGEAPTAEEIAPNLIPAAFHGTWDYTKGTCAEESDLRMEISAGQIIFYESLGQVRSIEAKDEMSLDVTLAMEGEGEVWTSITRLTLTDGGDILTPSAGTGEQAYDPMPRKKCPQ